MSMELLYIVIAAVAGNLLPRLTDLLKKLQPQPAPTPGPSPVTPTPAPVEPAQPGLVDTIKKIVRDVLAGLLPKLMPQAGPQMFMEDAGGTPVEHVIRYGNMIVRIRPDVTIEMVSDESLPPTAA